MKLKYLLSVLHIQILIKVLLFRCFLVLKSTVKIESLYKRALRFVLNDYDSRYEVLLERYWKLIMTLTCYRFLCIEAYKTLKNLN